MTWLADIGVFVLFFVAFVGVLVLARKLEAKTGGKYAKIAEDKGWQFNKSPGRHNHTVRRSLYSRARIKRIISDHIQGNHEGLDIEIFIHHRKVGNQTSQETIFCINDPHIKQCDFELIPLNFAHKLLGFLSGRGIDINAREEFSSRYKIKGDNEHDIRKLFRSDVQKYFADNPGISIESRDNTLLCYRLGKIVKSEDLLEELQSVVKIYRLLYTDAMQREFSAAL